MNKRIIMKKLDLFQLLSVIAEKEDEICLEAKYLNRLHQNLLKHSIRSDFSRNTLERIECDYPSYIEVKMTEVIVKKMASLKNVVYMNKHNVDTSYNQLIEEQWQLAIKES